MEVGTHLLGQEVDPDGILVWVGPQLNLRQHLVGEGVAHHEAGVAHGAAQVDQPALGQNDDAAPVLQQVAVHLQVGSTVVRAGGHSSQCPPLSSSYPPVQQASRPPAGPTKGLDCPRTTSSTGPGTRN